MVDQAALGDRPTRPDAKEQLDCLCCVANFFTFPLFLISRGH